jgi:carbamoyl-phosphate synthase large subunit
MISVLIAGVGGASLGTEVAKSLRLAGGYRILGCDVSPLAFGHYDGACDRTFLVSRDRYIADLFAICRDQAVQAIIPGGTEPTRLVSDAKEDFRAEGICLAANASPVEALAADKAQCFRELERLGFAVPRTVAIASLADLRDVPLPCVIKPSVDSGGSSFVFFARSRQEAELYASYLLNDGRSVIAQDYIPHDLGEFTVGVLSEPSGGVLGVIALKRAFPAKLSILAQGRDFLISSGVSQGHIGAYPEICATAEKIARGFGSVGPFNVQGRIDALGRFLPFEINPRFSASTYLRALAGFNEVDHFVRLLIGAPAAAPLAIRPGWYLRGLTEAVVPENGLTS